MYGALFVCLVFLTHWLGYLLRSVELFNSNSSRNKRSSKLLKLTKFTFSDKNQKEVFKPIISDWQAENLKAIGDENFVKMLQIDMRYTYAYLFAMWQKSPVGDLIEFIKKMAK